MGCISTGSPGSPPRPPWLFWVRKSQEESEGDRKSQEEPRKARGVQEEPGRARRPPHSPLEKKEGDAAADALADQVAETKVGEEEKAE